MAFWQYIINVFSESVKDVATYLPNITFIVFIFVIWMIVGKIINKFYMRISLAIRRRFDVLISKWVLKGLIYSFFILLILLNIPGIDETIVTTMGFILTGIVAFSSSTIIANGMSGLMIKLIASYKAGDVVKIGDTFGLVAEVKLLHTMIETSDRMFIKVPNSEVMKGGVTNYTKEHPLLKIKLTLGYDLDRLEAEKMLVKAAKSAGLEKVFVAVTNLGDHSIEYQVNGIVEDVRELPFIESNVRKNIIDQFQFEQKEILSPMYVCHRESDKLVVPKVTEDIKQKLLKKEAVEKALARKLEETIFEEADRLVIKEKIQQKKKIIEEAKKAEGEEKVKAIKEAKKIEKKEIQQPKKAEKIVNKPDKIKKPKTLEYKKKN